MRLCWDNRRAPKRRSMEGDSENRLRESLGIVCVLRRDASFPRTREYKIALGTSWGLRLGRVLGIIAIGEIPRLP
jgi:hypothetical protein